MEIKIYIDDHTYAHGDANNDLDGTQLGATWILR